MHRRHHLVAAILLACASALVNGPTASARTWRVPADFTTITQAVAASASGDTVLVSCGTYPEHDIVLGGGLTLRGETGDPACVVVDGQGLGRVFDLQGLTERVTIEGLTITGGRTPEGWLEAMGGGIRCQSSDLRLADVVFTANVARIGAGLGVYRSTVEIERASFVANTSVHGTWAAGGAIWIFESAGSIDDSVFDANSAFSTNPDDPGDGGAILCNRSQMTVTDCTFTGNSTGGGGGGYYSLSFDASALLRCHFEGNSAQWGGAMYFELDSRATIDQSVFRGNTADAGGALIVDRWCTPIFWDCVFEGNTATGASGGAAQCWSSSPLFKRCHFDANSSATEGGALFLGGAAARVEDCWFTGNTAAIRGGAVHVKLASPQLLRATLVGNSSPNGGHVSAAENSTLWLRRTIAVGAPQGGAAFADATSAVTASCANVFGNAGGDWVGPLAGALGIDGNLSADPLFVDAAAGDYTLACGSPCAADQTGSCGQIGAFTDDCPPEEPVGAPAVPIARPTVAVAPNPFNAHTMIAFTTPSDGPVRVVLHALDGRRVRTLASGTRAAGSHELVWDGRDDAGAEVASGTYLCRVETATATVATKLGLVK